VEDLNSALSTCIITDLGLSKPLTVDVSSIKLIYSLRFVLITVVQPLLYKIYLRLLLLLLLLLLLRIIHVMNKNAIASFPFPLFVVSNRVSEPVGTQTHEPLLHARVAAISWLNASERFVSQRDAFTQCRDSLQFRGVWAYIQLSK
jgi:hypothetical protein